MWEGRGTFLRHVDAGRHSLSQLPRQQTRCQNHHRAGITQEVTVWEGRGAFLYHVDAGGDIAAQTLTLAHLAHIWVRAGFSFSLVSALQNLIR